MHRRQGSWTRPPKREVSETEFRGAVETLLAESLPLGFVFAFLNERRPKWSERQTVPFNKSGLGLRDAVARQVQSLAIPRIQGPAPRAVAKALAITSLAVPSFCATVHGYSLLNLLWL